MGDELQFYRIKTAAAFADGPGRNHNSGEDAFHHGLKTSLNVDTLIAQGGKGAEFANSFKDKYGKLPQNSYTLYGVAALQVVLAGIAASDGTRAGLTSAVLGGSGVTISAADSVLGKEIHLDPKTGDTVALDVTIMQETDGAPKTLMPWAIQF